MLFAQQSNGCTTTINKLVINIKYTLYIELVSLKYFLRSFVLNKNI